jgi:hypothetical protein
VKYNLTRNQKFNRKMPKDLRSKYLTQGRMIADQLGGTIAGAAYLKLSSSISWARDRREVQKAFDSFTENLFYAYGKEAVQSAYKTVDDMIEMGWI